jgi:hypothetical protein
MTETPDYHVDQTPTVTLSDVQHYCNSVNLQSPRSLETSGPDKCATFLLLLLLLHGSGFA